jgi:predicted nucleic acid-binding protein
VLVLDASIVVELSLDRIGTGATDALGQEKLLAPPLLWSEVPSALHELAFREEISRTLADRALKRFLAGDIHVDERRPEGLTMAAWQLADELGWAKTYDAEYVALTKILGCRLVTLDMRLNRSVYASGLGGYTEQLCGIITGGRANTPGDSRGLLFSHRSLSHFKSPHCCEHEGSWDGAGFGG